MENKIHSIQEIDIDLVIPSKTSPRKDFNIGMKELIENIKAKGIIYPLKIRPISGRKYEIVNGERRYRAVKTIGLPKILAEIEEMTDEEAVQAQLISFEQNEDIHPLERAEAIFRLMKTAGNTAAVAASIGKPKSYVEQSLRLLLLIEPAKKAFRANYLTTGHAILLCRLQPADQKRAFEFAVKSWQQFEGSFDYRNEDNPDSADEKLRQLSDPARTVCSVKDLREFIELRINLDLSKAAFDIKDKVLIEKAGDCIDCHMRTGFNKDLFDDITKGDFCTNAECYHKKQESFLIQLKSEMKKTKKRYIEITKDQRKPAGHPGSMTERSFKYVTGKPCKHTRIGIFIDADSKGKTALICSSKKECKQHFGAEIKYRNESGLRSNNQEPRISYEEQERLTEIEKAKGEKRFRALVTLIWQNISDKLDIPQKRIIEMLSELILKSEIDSDLEQYKPKDIKLTTNRTINAGLLCQKYNFDLRYDGSIHPDLYKACKQLKIKFEPILQKITDEEKTTEKKLQPAAKKAAKSKK
jgi:ParB/RepB/Spo0J family partition protein